MVGQTDDYALAEQLVRDAGALAARMRRAGVGTRRKTSVSDIVTDADHAAEALIADRLRRERPHDGIVGEEGAAEPGARTWYVDPVDGTYNYASGLPIWCAALALTDDRSAEDGPVLGAVYHPAADELWIGGRDRPTTCNGEPVDRLVDRPLAELGLAVYFHPARLSESTPREPLLRAVGPAATMRSFGSGSVELSWVAGSRIGGYLQANCKPWDWLPGAALVRGAGGEARVIEQDGQRWHVAGPRRLVADAAAALAGGQ